MYAIREYSTRGSTHVEVNYLRTSYSCTFIMNSGNSGITYTTLVYKIITSIDHVIMGWYMRIKVRITYSYQH